MILDLKAMFVSQMDEIKHEHEVEVNQMKSQHMNEVQALLVSTYVSFCFNTITHTCNVVQLFFVS